MHYVITICQWDETGTRVTSAEPHHYVGASETLFATQAEAQDVLDGMRLDSSQTATVERHSDDMTIEPLESTTRCGPRNGGEAED
jgi:hypothetical protein